jgi:Carboxypeptidase regulatory-like domain
MTSKFNFAAWVAAGLVACFMTALAVSFLILPPAASAQSIFANLSGTVTDASGAVVPMAKVTIRNASTNVTREVTTNNGGFFSVTQLPTGTYTVTAEAKGFQRYQASGIVLNSSDNKTLNVSLKVGAETETVEVSATAGEVAVTDTGEKSDLITAHELNTLSLVGRNATEYVKLLAGATLAPNGAVNRPAFDGQVVGINGFAVGSNAGGLSNVNVNGQAVDITMDGQHSFDPGAAGNATPVNPNPEMISEVKILTSNFTAENPKGPVVLNTTTKGGGATFHGSAYMYARNSAMNAEDFFAKESELSSGLAPGQLKVPSSYYYPGFNIGGPIIIPGTGLNKSHHKLFFFEGFEYYKQDLNGGIDRSFVPTSDMFNGDFSGLAQYSSIGRSLGVIPTAPAAGSRLGFDERAAAGCTITGGVLSSQCLDPNAVLLLKDYLPAPNADPTGSGYNYVRAFSVAQNSWQNVVRGDYNISDSTKVYVTWSRQRETANMPMGLWINSGDNVVPAPSNALGLNGSDSTTVNLTHVFSPTMTSETTFGYTKINFPSSLSNPAKQTRAGVGFPLKGIFGDSNTPAVLSWGSSFANLGDVGHDYHPTMIAVKGIPSVSENFTKVIGTHTTKYGFYYEHVYNKQDNWGQFMGVLGYGATGWGGGSTGNEYADALMGIGMGSYFEQALPPPTNLAQNIAAFYAQDHWKLTRRISLDYGMRFEHYAKPYSDPFGLAIFTPSAYDSSIAPDVNTQTGITWHSLDKNVSVSGANSRLFFFSPRIGAAIDLFGNGKTVIRGGWGKYRSYDSVQSNDYVQPAQTATGSSSWSCGWNDPLCPTWESVDSHALTAPTYGTGLAPGVKGVFVMDPKNDEQPLITTYSLTVDQQLPAKFRLEASYVGNYGQFFQSYTNFYNGIPLGTITTAAFTAYPADCGSPTNDQLGSQACEQHFRTFPDYTTINESITAGKSQYDSFQASVRRDVGVVTLLANYTFSKALGDTGNQLSNGGLPSAISVAEAEHYLWGVLPTDRAHVLSLAYVFSMPKLTGNAFVRGALGGWQLSGITQIESGAQLSSSGGLTSLNFNLTQAGTSQDNVHLLGSPDVTLYPSITCNPAKGITGTNQFANPSCFGAAPVGQLGNGAHLPYLPGPKFWNSDLTLLKNFKITERQNLQFRIAAFNFLNHGLLSFTNNDNNLKLNIDANGRAQSDFGVAQHRVGGRLMEVGVKYSF